jgi:hypothetical protein
LVSPVTSPNTRRTFSPFQGSGFFSKSPRSRAKDRQQQVQQQVQSGRAAASGPPNGSPNGSPLKPRSVSEGSQLGLETWLAEG